MDLYTKYNDSTYDIINLPYGGHELRFGLTVLVKISYPIYQSGINSEQHEKFGLTSKQVYEEEKSWYLNEITKNK